MRRHGGAAALVALACGFVAAEVPPLATDKLEAEAELIVTGKVTAVEVRERKPPREGLVKEEQYRLTVAVARVKKGKPKGAGKSLVACGSYFELRPGTAGSAGHYSANSEDRVGAVEKGWELTLYLKAAKDGSYDIVYPNGFAVVRKPRQRK